MATLANSQHAVRVERAGAEPLPSDRALKLVPDPAKAGEALKTAARLAATSATQEIRLGWLWEELATERSRAVDTFCHDGRGFVILQSTNELGCEFPLLNARSLALFQRVLLGAPQKVIAIELGVSPSLVAATASHCAHAMGFGCSATKIPFLLLMAARACSEPAPRVAARRASFTHEGTDYQVVSAARPEASEWRLLSPAEREVVELLVERRTNAEIGRLRRTSARTVANQITSVQRKLGARGRSEILNRLIRSAEAHGGVDAANRST